ncbi:MAG: phospho-sugar mutase [Clostridia bacterium]|nr:phospho-sugar mutase [Clostridia bacterium]
MTIKEKFDYWYSFDEDTKNELLSLTDEKEIEDRFYKDLEFGTGGLRGIMGAGPNRMNRYTIAKATKGYADYLKSSFKGEISVAIAYDSRNNSQYFSQVAAGVLASNGIKVYIYDTLMPTPVLSFTAKYLGCNGGIVLTASHNPKEYNGYKIYDEKGCQLVPQFASQVIDFVNAITDLKSVDVMDFDAGVKSGKITVIGEEVLEKFLDEVKKQSIYEEKSDLKIVYTALHGTGNIPVRKALEGMNVSIVKSQELPDGNFSTVRSPNPEEKDALTIAIEQAKTEKADLVLGTDPDCDRVGTAVLHNGEYVLMTGNQIGALLVDFVLSHRKDTLNEKSTLVKTIVTSEVGADIARSYGLNIVDTLTGFKYIGDQIGRYEVSGDREFVIGYEESYGYLVGTHARDKDAVVSSMLICQMAAYHKNNGRTLVDALNNIYAKFGFYLDALDTFVLKGKDGAEKIQSIMTDMRENGNSLFDNIKNVLDYSKGIDDLPKENVLKYIFTDGSWIAIRPSGTEPKLKVYYSMCGETKTQATEKLEKVRAILKKVIEE